MDPYVPREKRLHESLFDTLSWPLSKAVGAAEKDDGLMFSGKKVRWNHFGKKYTLRISDYEMEYADVFDAFMKKVREERPDFEGALAYIDQYGRQTIVQNDRDLRDALHQTKGKLKLHTTLPEGGVISAAEMVGRPARSQSVPPERGYHSYPPANSRSPSSMESAPATYRNRAASPPPAPQSYNQPMHVKTSMSSAGSYAGYQSPGGYSYGVPAPYSQSLLYGMPPHNPMLLRFLANPFPHPFSYARSYIGPNKYHQFGGWGGRYYSGGGLGPIW